MNERIKELMLQAQKDVWVNNPYNGSPEFEGYELDPEKFAELIVKDMMTNLAAHVLSGSSAADVFAQWQEIYEGKVVERPVQAATNDYDF